MATNMKKSTNVMGVSMKQQQLMSQNLYRPPTLRNKIVKKVPTILIPISEEKIKFELPENSKWKNSTNLIKNTPITEVKQVSNSAINTSVLLLSKKKYSMEEQEIIKNKAYDYFHRYDNELVEYFILYNKSSNKNTDEEQEDNSSDSNYGMYEELQEESQEDYCQEDGDEDEYYSDYDN
jgi:hypothetical protein